jgi:hypothetical protein
MNTGPLVFSQVIAHVPHWEFQRLAKKHVPADRRRRFSAWDHFLALGFAQMTFRESLRDIEACLGSQQNLRYQLGFRARVTRSTLARANEERSWTLFAALAHKLIERARGLYVDEPHALDLPMPVYAVDSTLIDLSLALCPWVNWTGTTAAVKLHVALDLRGPLPAFVTLTEASRADVLWLDDLPIEPGSFYVMDRGYIDFRRLRRLDEAGAFFVVRDRSDVKYCRVASHPVPPTGTVRSDQSIRLRGCVARPNWPGLLRRVSLYDPEHSRWIVVWTNQWTLSATLIAELYRQRWQVELFFRWVKQTLRIRTFYGTSDNAVRVQLWSAIALYLAIAITRKSLGLSTNLTTLVQVLSLHALSRLPINELFATSDCAQKNAAVGEQLMLNHI